MKNSLFNELTNLYSLSKTLRFELKPIWKTAELVNQSEFFLQDEKKAEAYPDLKIKMDAIHRAYIEQSLSSIEALPLDQSMVDVFFAKKDGQKERESQCKKLRSIVAWSFVDVKNLLDKTMLDKLLIVATDEEKEQIEQFKWFWWYFTTYTQNRANLYKNEDKAWQIAFRLIDENLPRFFEALSIIDKIKTKSPDFMVIEKNEYQQEIEKKLSDYDHIFALHTYHQYLSQSGIDSYNTVVWHINLSLNQRKQQQGIKFSLLPLLYKLPLAPRKVISRLPQQFDHIDQVYESVKSVIVRIDSAIIPFIQTIFDLQSGYNHQGIYISLKTTEHRWSIALKWRQSLRWMTHDASKNDEEAKVKKEKNEFPFASLAEIADYLDSLQTQWQEAEFVFGDKIWIDKPARQTRQINSFSWLFFELLGEYIDTAILNYATQKLSYENDPSKTAVKNILDSAMGLWRFISWFDLIHKKKHIQASDKDSDFYEGENGLEKTLRDENYPDPVHTIYDKVRNFLTKKPYNNDEKIKVNFENPTLLGGRDQNKEKENFAIILREWNLYYLALMKKWKNNFFDEVKNPSLYNNANQTMQKMIYKLLPWPNKMLPKVIFSAKNIWLFNPSSEIIRIRKEETFKQWEQFSLTDLHTWIDFLKLTLRIYDGRKWYDFVFKSTQEYNKINEFYHDVERQWYSMRWLSINKDMIMEAGEKWSLYLFQIYNKDFANFATGASNIHTSYFRHLFDPSDTNLFKINGEAEIFYRKWIDIKEQTHRLSPKHHASIIDKKRYTTDKILFHLPITLNFCRQENQLNKRLNALIQWDPKPFTILGIDRGEKHLLYYSLIDQQWTIIKTWSRNTIPNSKTGIATDYHAKLDDRERARDEAQLAREQQAQIKDLKAGYISQVINEVAKIVIEHNALIILEDLNGGFKRGRQKVEKNVYQQFELALAKKLNYLVFKNTPDDQAWWVLKAYQLTPPVAQFQDLHFQTGIMLYTPAWYTSTTCPCCGWRKNIYISYENEKKAKQQLVTLTITKSDQDFLLSYIAQSKSATQETITTQWQVRLMYDRQTKQTLEYTMTTKFAEILWSDFDNLLSRLTTATAKQCKDLIWAINLLLKMRNAETGTDTDTISCPSCGFDSRDWFQWQDYNGDANGAYNIARKGILILDKIIAGEKSTIVKQEECDEKWRKWRK